MTKHTRWETVIPLLDRRGLEVQLAYVDGYILALEDLLEDLADTRARWLQALRNNFTGVDSGKVEEAMVRYVESIFKDVRREAGRTRESAITTRKTLKEIYGNEEVSDPAAPDPAHRGDSS